MPAETSPNLQVGQFFLWWFRVPQDWCTDEFQKAKLETQDAGQTNIGPDWPASQSGCGSACRMHACHTVLDHVR